MSQLQTFSCMAAHIKYSFSLYGIHSAGKKKKQPNLFEVYFLPNEGKIEIMHYNTDKCFSL